MTDSRQFAPEIDALSRQEAGRTQLLAPAPGLWREAPSAGSLIRPGMTIGWLEQLGVLRRLRVPERAQGVVVEAPGKLARRPVDYGALLLTLDPEALVAAAIGPDEATGEAAGAAALVFRSPSSGRFFARPAPDKPAFVTVGQVLERGHTIGLLEVMKTFTRLHYDDPKLPARARVKAIVVADQSDIDAGATLLVLEPA